MKVVRGKGHGEQEIRGLRFMSEEKMSGKVMLNLHKIPDITSK